VDGYVKKSDSFSPETSVAEENYLRKRWLAVSRIFGEFLDVVH
jgi:hypothetical protein